MTTNDVLLARTLLTHHSRRPCHNNNSSSSSSSECGSDVHTTWSPSRAQHAAYDDGHDAVVPACTLPRLLRCAVHIVGVTQTNTRTSAKADTDDVVLPWTEVSVAAQVVHMRQPLTPVMHSRVVTSDIHDTASSRNNNNSSSSSDDDNEGDDDDVTQTTTSSSADAVVVAEACIDERVEFDLPLCALPLDARVSFVVRDAADDGVVAVTSLALYTLDGVLKIGLVRCPLYSVVEATAAADDTVAATAANKKDNDDNDNDDSGDDDDAVSEKSDGDSDDDVQRVAVMAASLSAAAVADSDTASLDLLRELHTHRQPRIPWLDELTMRHVHAQHVATARTQRAAAAAAVSSSLSCAHGRVVGFLHLWLPVTQPPCVVAFVEPSLLPLLQQQQKQQQQEEQQEQQAPSNTTRNDGDSDDDRDVAAVPSRLLTAYDANVHTPYMDGDAATARTYSVHDACAALLAQSSWLHAASHLFAANSNNNNSNTTAAAVTCNDKTRRGGAAAATAATTTRRSRHAADGEGCSRCYRYLHHRTLPSAHDRQRLTVLAYRPPIQLEGLHIDDVQLLWRCAAFAVRDRRLFVPFLRSVAWLVYVHKNNNNNNNDNNNGDDDDHERTACDEGLPAQLAYAVRVLLAQWRRTIGLAEVLACLSSTFARVRVVRLFAVQQLQHTRDAQLCELMPQLVQAARFDSAHDEDEDEKEEEADVAASRQRGDSGEGDRDGDDATARTLGGLLVSRALRNWELCCTLYWCVTVEAALEARDAHSRRGNAVTSSPAHHTQHDSDCDDDEDDDKEDDADAGGGGGGGDACATRQQQQQQRPPLCALRRRLLRTLAARQPSLLRRLRQQRRLVRAVRTLAAQLQRDGADRNLRIAHGRQLLDARAGDVRRLLDTSTSAHDNNSNSSNSDRSSSSIGSEADRRDAVVTLPTHPRVCVCDVVTSRFFVYKSAKMPIQLSFVTDAHMLPTQAATTRAQVAADDMSNNDDNNDGEADACAFAPSALRNDEANNSNKNDASSDDDNNTAAADTSSLPLPVVSLMYKTNDDVRQDQLMLRLLGVVDRLLRDSGLDLCLTAYRVCPTGPSDGFIELVPDVVTFQSVQRDAVRYLRTHNTSPAAFAAAMSRYTRSLAGYSVFTFVFGVGDRHLENILLARDGRLLHVDYGYVLGHDPKPFAPPMKLRREMIEVLGGPQSGGYAAFLSYCCSAYHVVRAHAALLLHLLLLMRHARALPQLTGAAAAAPVINNNNNNSSSSSSNASPLVSSPVAATTLTTATTTAGAARDGDDDVVAPEVHLLRVQDKLRLDLTHAQATQYLCTVIADSVGSVFTNLWDVLHAAAQATRT